VHGEELESTNYAVGFQIPVMTVYIYIYIYRRTNNTDKTWTSVAGRRCADYDTAHYSAVYNNYTMHSLTAACALSVDRCE